MSGTADNCKIISVEDFKKDPYSDFILGTETAYVVLQSLKDINIFTDQVQVQVERSFLNLKRHTIQYNTTLNLILPYLTIPFLKGLHQDLRSSCCWIETYSASSRLG